MYATIRLLKAELKLMIRDPLVLTFVFVFPVVTMLIIGGSFGTSPDPAFDGVNPAHWYVASYFTVVIAATGLIMLPVHLASYRERGVLRRFAAAGFPQWSFALAQLAVGLTAIAVGSAILLAVAGTIVGILMSYGTRFLMDTFVPSMTTVIVKSWWWRAALIALAGSLIGALGPGLKAARQDAIEALSYD